ncbi:MAG: carboxypeptidase regulatory-like domain-containing protein [Planctomycetaceae bacterium]|nr:carboxypeptidase regulatory-like domain-containing protein [Planctomycetaceae bacterium]
MLVTRRSVLRVSLAISMAIAGVRVHAADGAGEAGVIEGTITYRADAKRPWRYGRYYINDASTAALAEAVVALRGKRLAEAAGPAEPATVTIDQKNFQFVPETVVVRTGDSVTFTNSDDAQHNVRASGRIADFNVTVGRGQSHTVVCDKAGGAKDPIQVGCIFHSSMRAWVFVFDHPYFQLTGEDGKFRLENIPPGKYDLEVRHPAGDLQRRTEVEVRPGETLQVDIAVSPDDKD